MPWPPVSMMLLVLKGRKIIAFPDIDGFQDWTEKLARFPDLGITVSPILNQNATAEDLENHIDIADWLIRYCRPEHSEATPTHCVAFLRAARFLDPAMHDEIEALIDDLGLEFMGEEKVETAEEDSTV